MHQKSLVNEVLIFIGVLSGGASVTLQNIDLIIGILLKLTSLITFVCYVIINHELILHSYNKFISRFKKSK